MANQTETIEVLLKMGGDYSRELQKFTADLTKGAKAPKGTWDQFNRTLKTTQRELGGVLQRQTKFISSLASMKTMIAGVVGAAVTRSFFQAGAELENLTVQFEALYKSSAMAEKTIAEVRQTAAKTPFQLADLAESRRLLARLSGGALDTTKALVMVGDAAAVTADRDIKNLSMWVGRAYDMLQNGRPAGEAMMRLSELGVITSKTRNEIEQFQKAGMNTQAWEVLQEALLDSAGAMEKMAETGTGKLSTIKDQLAELQRQFLGEGIWEDGQDLLSKVRDTLDEWIEDGTVKELGKQAAEFMDTIKELLPYADELIKVWFGAKMTGAIYDFTKAMLGARKEIKMLLPLLAKFVAIPAAAGAVALTPAMLAHRDELKKRQRAKDVLAPVQGDYLKQAELAIEFDNFFNAMRWDDSELKSSSIKKIMDQLGLKSRDEMAEMWRMNVELQKLMEQGSSAGGSTFIGSSRDSSEATSPLAPKKRPTIVNKDAKKLAKEFSKERSAWNAERIENDYDKELAFIEKWRDDTLDKYKSVAGAKAVIDEEYKARTSELDKTHRERAEKENEEMLRKDEALRKQLSDELLSYETSRIQDKYARELAELEIWRMNQIEAYKDVYGFKKMIDEEYAKRKEGLDKQQADRDRRLSEKAASDRIAAQQMIAQNIVGTFAIAAQANDKWKGIYKASAIAMTWADGYRGAMKAYADAPFGLKTLSAAASIAYAGAQTAQIAKLHDGRGPLGYGRTDNRPAMIARDEMVLTPQDTANIVWSAAKNGNGLGGTGGGTTNIFQFPNFQGDPQRLGRQYQLLSQSGNYQKSAQTVGAL